METPENLSVSVGRRGAHARVVVAGELDMHTSPVLSDWLSCVGDANVIDVDAGGVTFIDSSGLQTLLDAQKATSDRGAELRIVVTSERVARLVEIAGVADLLLE